MAEQAINTSDGTTPSGRSDKRIRTLRGVEMTCRGWHQEAALRMLMNSLDEEVAERPEELIVCGGTVKPVRDWDCYHAVANALHGLRDDETLLIQSGEPAGIFETSAEAPRVLIADWKPADIWLNGDQIPDAERLGPAMFGHDAARSWTYIGSQQALHTVFETFAAVGRQHFAGDLSGRLIVSGGMGAAGGAQPLAATLQGAAFLGIDVDVEKITRRIRLGYCDFCVYSLDEALRILKNAVRQKQPVAVGLAGNCAELIPELARRGVIPDVLTDLTGGALDPLNRYVPAGLTLKEAKALRHTNPDEYLQRARDSLARHARGMMELRKLGAVAFDFGNHLGRVADDNTGFQYALGLPGFVSTYLRPAFSRGRVPLRWVALSGDGRDIHRTDELLLDLFPDDPALARWIRLARKHVKFRGLPARVGWLGPEQRVQFAERLNALVEEGELKAPLVIARDRINCGAEVSRLIEPGGVKGGSGTAKARSILDALLCLDSGASWISVECGTTEETAYTCHATKAAVADGTPGSAKRLQRIMENECGFSRLRDADRDNAQGPADPPVPGTTRI